MTGATQYRIQAASREEAIQIAFEELRPNEATMSLIMKTLYAEDEAQRFCAKPDPESPKTTPHLRLAD
ncbi:MAG: hypothetical protein P4M08_03075 [Oligoflexia bacterium]|nr:hypothetical protein [Oligoflexia bacterium]